MLILASIMAGAYLAGSVNFSILVLRASGRGDPRDRFSGNAGITNVQRVAGRGWAAAVLLLDLGRAIAIAATAHWVLPLHLAIWVAAGLVLGNRFPCFHGLRGGKGVAAFLGFTIWFAPLWATGACVAWVVVWALTRRPFVGSMAMIAVLAAGLSHATGWHPTSMTAAMVVAGFIVAAHHRNFREFLAS